MSDGAGANLGLLVEWGGTTSYLPALNALIQIHRGNATIIFTSDVYFQFPGCQGDAYILDRAAGFLTPAGAPDRFFLGRPAIAANTSYNSYLTDTTCIGTSGAQELIPAEEITEPLGFTSQLVAPISFHQLTSP